MKHDSPKESFRQIVPNLFVSYSDFDKIILSDGDSLVVPIPHYYQKQLSVSISNRSMSTIPWIENISFKDILKKFETVF